MTISEGAGFFVSKLYYIFLVWGISCSNNGNFSKTYEGHVLNKNSLDKTKPAPSEIVIIKCIKITFKKNYLFFAPVTVRKLKVFEIYNRAYLYRLLK